MFAYISNTIFRALSDVLSIIGSILMFSLPIVAVLSIIQFVQSDFLFYLVAPLIVFLVSKILLSLAQITDEIASS